MFLELLQGIDWVTVVFEVVQTLCIILTVMKSGKKDRNADGKIDSIDDLIALAEYHEKMSVEIRKITNKEK